MFSLLDKYRSFQAYNKYDRPGLFMTIGFGKTLLEFTMVFAVVWYGITFLSGNEANTLPTSMTAQQKATSKSAEPIVLGSADNLPQIEIPAVAVESVVYTSPVQTISQPNFETYATESHSSLLAGMHNPGWLLKQNKRSYVIQLASSTDKATMYQKAFEFSNSFPSVVFPFRKTSSGRVMYGYSIGLFSSLEEARQSANTLSEAATNEGIWIRQIGELQSQISNVN